MEDFALITEGALYVFVLAEKLDVLAKVRRSRVWIKEQNCLSFQKLTRPRMHTDGTELRTKEQLGCVYTYPDIRISGYPDLRDPDIFGASTRIGSKRFRRLHVSRHPDPLYAAYSLRVGEVRKSSCMPSNSLLFFLSFC